MSTEADALIAGAGPAGSALALRLARAGARVLLVDAKLFPRDKLCGEFYSPEVVSFLEELGLGDDLARQIPPPVASVAFTDDTGARVAVGFDRPGFGLPRATFDEILRAGAERAGATWRPDCRILAIEDAGSAFRVRSSHAGRPRTDLARVVIDATGHGSPFGTRPHGEDQRAWVGFQRTALAGAVRSAALELEMFPLPGAYAGICPVGNGVVNVCLVARREALRHAGGPEALWDAMRRASRPFAARIEALEADPDAVRAPGSAADGTRLRATARLWFGWRGAPGPALQIGDAAGTLPPVVGDGTATAIRSAALAEAVVHAYLDRRLDWPEARARYAHAWRREFGLRFRVARVLHEAAVRPRAARPFVRVARCWPGLSGALLAATRGGPAR